MRVSNSLIQFRIDIYFENCDVDTVYQEARQSGYIGIVPHLLIEPHTHKIKGNTTPTSDTVDFALQWLSGFVDRNKMCTTDSKWDTDYTNRIIQHLPDGTAYTTGTPFKTELEQIGIEVVSTYGLMMGTCHLICEVDSKLFSPELVNQANNIVFEVFKRFVKYYKKGRKITA